MRRLNFFFNLKKRLTLPNFCIGISNIGLLENIFVYMNVGRHDNFEMIYFISYHICITIE